MLLRPQQHVRAEPPCASMEPGPCQARCCMGVHNPHKPAAKKVTAHPCRSRQYTIRVQAVVSPGFSHHTTPWLYGSLYARFARQHPVQRPHRHTHTHTYIYVKPRSNCQRPPCKTLRGEPMLCQQHSHTHNCCCCCRCATTQVSIAGAPLLVAVRWLNRLLCRRTCSTSIYLSLRGVATPPAPRTTNGAIHVLPPCSPARQVFLPRYLLSHRSNAASRALHTAVQPFSCPCCPPLRVQMAMPRRPNRRPPQCSQRGPRRSWMAEPPLS